MQGTVAKLSVRLEPFPPGLLLVRGCRVHLPSVWSTRCACPTGAVVFRFILLCLCLPVSRGRIGGTVVASPCQGTCHVACLLARRVVFRPPASRTFLLKGFVDSAGRGQLRPRRPAAPGPCRGEGIRLHQQPTPSRRRVTQPARPLRRPEHTLRVVNKPCRCGVLESSDRLFRPRFLAFLG
jgi:hypothetical protein